MVLLPRKYFHKLKFQGFFMTSLAHICPLLSGVCYSLDVSWSQPVGRWVFRHCSGEGKEAVESPDLQGGWRGGSWSPWPLFLLEVKGARGRWETCERCALRKEFTWHQHERWLELSWVPWHLSYLLKCLCCHQLWTGCSNFSLKKKTRKTCLGYSLPLELSRGLISWAILIQNFSRSLNRRHWN